MAAAVTASFTLPEARACTQVALRSTFDAGSPVVEFGGRLVGPPASIQTVPPPSVTSARPLAVMKPPPVAVTLPLTDFTVTRPAGAWLAYCRALRASNGHDGACTAMSLWATPSIQLP